MSKPTWITPAGFIGTVSELVSTSTSIIASGTSVTYSLISGILPVGLSISSGGVISGIPEAVVNKVRKKFVVRAKNIDGVADRTFYMDAEGPDDPTWSTAPGYLPLGYNGEGYIINNQNVEYNLAATAIIPDDTRIQYYIEEGDGTLPGGIRLEKNGLLHGKVYEELPAGSVPILFQFYVTATDGVSSAKRLFKFYVLSPDLFRADSTFFSFTTTFVTSSTLVASTPTSSTVYSFSTNLNTNTDLSLLSINDIVTSSVTGIPTNTKITAITTNSFTVNKASTAIMPSGTDLTFSRASGIDILTVDVLESSVGYLQPPEFINGNDLGTVRANNNEDISVEAYDAAPYRGPVTYNLVTGTTVSTRLPEGLVLDSETGYIWGNIPYQPAYTRSYTLTVQATKTDNRYGTQVTATNTFTLAVKGEVESSIEWVTNSDLGNIETGTISELAVEARQVSSDYNIKYTLTDGNLPNGLNLARDGALTGMVEYNQTGTFTFNVLASDVYELSWINRTFSVNVVETLNKEYTKIYCRPFLTKEKRAEYLEFTTNNFTFDPTLIYRFYDPNFGVQSTLKVYLEFGIEKVNLEEYANALTENFYRRRLYFGDLKKAIAKNSEGITIYEIIYVDVKDDLINNTGTSVSKQLAMNNNLYYPASITNMREQLESITLPDSSIISVNADLLPKFMNTPQQGSYQFPGYMRVIPICYALPGQGDRIISRIRLSNFDFKLLDFEIDRIIVESSADSATAKYLLLGQQNLSGY